MARLIVVVAALLGFWRLGSTAFNDADEARYAQSAREMIENGDYLTVTYRQEPHFGKPPGKMWSIAAGYALFGVNEFGARFTSALFSVGAVALTMVLGAALFGRSAGLLSGLILLGSTQFWHEHCARTASIEPELTFFYVLAMIGIARMGRDRRWYFALAFAAGAVSMLKAPHAIPIAAVAVIHALATGGWRRLGAGTILAGIGIYLAVALPWHAWQLVLHGADFRRAYFDAQIIGRVTGWAPADLIEGIRGLEAHRGPLFYPKVLFYSVYPWSILALPALLHALYLLFRDRRHPALLPVLHLTVFGAAFTIARGKLPWYIIPALPALALVIAGFVRELWRHPKPAAAVLLAALALSFLFVPNPQYTPYRRLALNWPGENPNVVPLWNHAANGPAARLPAIVTVALLAGGAAYLVRKGGRAAGAAGAAGANGAGRVARTARAVAVASFLFFGLYGAALPLRHAGFRGAYATLYDGVARSGIPVDRVLLVGRRSALMAESKIGYFYFNAVAGGRGDRVTAAVPSGTKDLVLRREIPEIPPGTLVIFDGEYGDYLARLPGMRVVGGIDAPFPMLYTGR